MPIHSAWYHPIKLEQKLCTGTSPRLHCWFWCLTLSMFVWCSISAFPNKKNQAFLRRNPQNKVIAKVFPGRLSPHRCLFPTLSWWRVTLNILEFFFSWKSCFMKTHTGNDLFSARDVLFYFCLLSFPIRALKKAAPRSEGGSHTKMAQKCDPLSFGHVAWW